MRKIVRLLTILVLIVGTIGTLDASRKIVTAGVQLIVLRDNASYFNESSIITDGITEAYNENNEMRQEIYQSDDNLVRAFSNMNAFVKLIVFCIAILMFPGIVLMWIYVIYSIYLNWKRRKRKKSRRIYNQ